MIVFKSQATGDVMMFDDVGKRLLVIMGKSPDKQGVITVEQLPDAIARLKQAAMQSKAPPKPADDEEPKEKTPSGSQRDFVSLAQRAAPLIEMLERALKEEKPVVWGV